MKAVISKHKLFYLKKKKAVIQMNMMKTLTLWRDKIQECHILANKVEVNVAT